MITVLDSTAPVVDSARWPLLDPFVVFNDTFFMALLFLVSGLFTISSLKRKSSKRYLKSRLKRLGIPFAIASVTIIPMAYWPSYLLAAPASDTSFWITFFTIDGWPVGPVWFLWSLLAFNIIVALIYKMVPSLIKKLHYRPTGFVILLATIASYLSLRLWASPYSWTSLGGPFDVQTSRIALYFTYFLLGAMLGNSQQWWSDKWITYWKRWFVLGIISFFFHLWLQTPDTFAFFSLTYDALRSLAFAGSCAGLSIGFIGIFRSFVHQSKAILDDFTANAYGIYVVHYVFITWLQFVLLSVSWAAWIKFSIVFIGGLILSWGASKLLRKIPAVRQIL